MDAGQIHMINYAFGWGIPPDGVNVLHSNHPDTAR